MKQLAYITQGHSDYDERLRSLLDASGIRNRVGGFDGPAAIHR